LVLYQLIILIIFGISSVLARRFTADVDMPRKEGKMVQRISEKDKNAYNNLFAPKKCTLRLKKTFSRIHFFVISNS